MKKMLIILLVLSCGTCSKQIRVYKATATNTHHNGLFYILPRNILEIVIPIKKIEKTDNSIEYELLSPVVNVLTEPDPEEIYAVDYRGGLFSENEIQLSLKENGLITSGESKWKNVSAEMAVRTIETAASVTVPFLSATKLINSLIDSINNISSIDQNIKPIIIKSINSWFTDYKSKRVYDISDIAIMKKSLEEKKEKLITGEKGSFDSNTLSFMIQEIDKRIELYDLQLKGIKKISISNKTARLLIEKDHFLSNSDNTIAKYKLLEFKNDNYDFHESPHKHRVVEAKNETLDNTVFITVSKKTGDYIDKLNKSINGNCKSQSFYYRVPKNIDIKIEENKTKNNIIHYTNKHLIAQMGFVVSLPNSIGMGSNKSVKFYDSTGALKEVFVSSESINPEYVSRIGTSLTNVLDSIKEEKSKQEESKDELTVLKRQREILEEKKKIKELEDYLSH